MRVRLFFLIGSMLCGLTVTAQTKYTDTEYGPGGYIKKTCTYNEIDSIWTCYHYYQNGQLMEIETLAANGFSPNGSKIGFNPNGNIAYSLIYRNEILYGPFTEYFPDGTIKRTGQFYNMFKTGKWKEYNEKGKVTSEIEYILTKADSTYNRVEDDDRLVIVEIRFGQPIKLKMKDEIKVVNAPVTLKFAALEPKKKR